MANNFIEFKDVVKHFPSNPEPTLNHLSLSCEVGTINVVLGFSGSGKSVSMKHVLGLLKPDKGQMLIYGKDLSEMGELELREIRKNFGMLFQSSALFDSLSVYENVAFPIREFCPELSEKKVSKKVKELLDSVSLSGAEYKMPADLSGGMKKRVGMARAIALDPKIVLCDEPTTGLDPVTSRTVDELIVNTVNNLKASAFIISHDIKAALNIGDKVSMIHAGKIIESGTPKEFIHSNNPVVHNFLQSAGVIK